MDLHELSTPDLDELVAEVVMGYRRRRGPAFDYDGPCEAHDLLVPPSMSDEDFDAAHWPPRGVIHPHFLMPRDSFSGSLSGFTALTDRMGKRGWTFSVDATLPEEGIDVIFHKRGSDLQAVGTADTLARAAAIAAVNALRSSVADAVL